MKPVPAFATPIHVGSPNVANQDSFARYVSGIFERKWLTNDGPLVRELESEIAQHLGVRNVVLVCNGTIGLELVVRALDITGEVILPSYTFIATAHAVQWQQLTPVFADIDAKTHCVDVASIEKCITPRTSAIIAVHLWGQAAAVAELQALATRHGLRLIYDAAHAFSCSHRGQMIGGFGDAEVFSFHATKFFNTFEGGCISTNDDALAAKLRLMRNFGFYGFDNVIHEGTNGKMTEVCAAMGLANLPELPRLKAINQQKYALYCQLLGDCAEATIYGFDADMEPNYQYVVLELADEIAHRRDQVVAHLHAHNVLARRYFWPGCHNMLPYRERYPQYAGQLKSTAQVANRVIVLPTGPAVSDAAITTICELVREGLSLSAASVA